ncbi:FecR domain-containing protein [Burkholderia sp. 22PA0106]|uniref:FecR domain-containing protein n=1 Tax=Burkholderia sp. 22PA0106 TaxID=3237371 RepID=UPI0039C18D10
MAASSSPGPGVQADFDSLEQAAQWYATLYDGDAGDERREAWAQWLAQRPEHRRAWAHIEAVSRRFAPLRVDGERDANATAVTVSAQRPAARRRVLGALAMLGGAGLAGWIGWRDSLLSDRLTAWQSDYSTGVGERRDIRLADGTQVWLNTDSAFDADYSDVRRQLRLRMGELLVDTGKDGAGRPFFVSSPNGRMQALGTRFTVRQAGDVTILSVYEGRVSIDTLAGQREIVAAGRQRSFTAVAIGAESQADPAREAWSRGVILADDITLGDLMTELARYRHGHIDVDPRVAGIRVVCRFPAADPGQTLAILERDLPIRVRRPLPWWTSISAR